jgi:two-component system response regulator NreC
MDLSMPEMNGLEATRAISALGLDTKVLVLTVHAEEEYLVPVVEAGGSGYLTKTSADTDLIEAIKVVARGEVFLPPKAATLLLQQYKAAEEDDDQSALHELSSREREVLALTAEGYSSREIGKKLFISPKTVDTYRSRIMSKLELNHRSELVRFALRVGLLKEI